MHLQIHDDAADVFLAGGFEFDLLYLALGDGDEVAVRGGRTAHVELGAGDIAILVDMNGQDDLCILIEVIRKRWGAEHPQSA